MTAVKAAGRMGRFGAGSPREGRFVPTVSPEAPLTRRAASTLHSPDDRRA
jgi:hypothetical protein